jgi:hypothetical protein
MILEKGKFYRTRSTNETFRVIGRINGNETGYPMVCASVAPTGGLDECYTEDGRANVMSMMPYDLVEEVPDPSTSDSPASIPSMPSDRPHVSELGDHLIAFGAALKDPNSTLPQLVDLASACGLTFGISIIPRSET